MSSPQIHRRDLCAAVAQFGGNDFARLAIGYSLLTWILQMIVNLGAAGFFVSREGLSIGQLVRASSQERERAEAGVS